MPAALVAWYKVDAADNDLRLFCEYLVTAVRLQRPALGSEQLLELEPGGGNGERRIAG
jgi:ATP/maltotriose-dependent transcriptional regulator MalT